MREAPDPSKDPDPSLPALAPDFVEQQAGSEMEHVVPKRGYDTIPMVGLGGSAGSLAPLQEFFRSMQADSGMAFVVVMHLSPTHESSLDEVLGRATKMPVRKARDGEKVQPNHVYVIPPGKNLVAVEGHLRLSDLDPERGRRIAIDLFFRSLADSHGPRSAAIVLSGADGDGALGVKRIKERGGLTIAQDPDEAEHATMPRTAINTGMIDWVLQVSEMPRRLVAYVAQEKTLKLPSEDGPQPAQPVPPTAAQGEMALREVLAYLRTRTGCDFSCYKRGTIVRRIGRRMQVNGIDDLPAYLTLLRTHPGEAGALLQDLLISVTNFFRDRDAFAVLETHVAHLFKNKGPNDAVRVWVPACATGEEAYSIAILLLEYARQWDAAPSLQVFACDLDEEAIRQARAGLYPATITADVSEERLRNFFIKDDRGYRVRRELREMVLFAVHDLLKDAPFSRIDLISCRNLLIYLNRDAQRRVFDTFHFALRAEGLLFLGSSESAGDDSSLFRALDKASRVYIHERGARVGFPIPSGPGTLQRTLEEQERGRGEPVIHGRRFFADSGQKLQPLRVSAERGLIADLHFKLIERFGPPSVLVNAERAVVHLSENAGRFLQHTGGEPSADILRIVHPMLRAELRAALFRAAESDAPVHALNLPVDLNGQPHLVDLAVSPANDLAPGYLLITFAARARQDGVAAPAALTSAAPESVVRQLERELEHLRFHLRNTVEQHEASNEEMKASNEELQAMNEELRSASEELETSREELQSINEELTTVNAELKAKVDELAHANSDLQNLMASTAIPTLFLDRELAITRYTPNAVELFYLIPGDVGRPMAHIKHRVHYPELMTDVERVLRTLLPSEREVRAENRWFLARAQPYRTLDDHIAGVVVTFIDVNELKEAQAAVAAREEHFRRAIQDAPIPVIMHAEDGQVLQISRTWTELTGYTEAQIPTFEAWLNRAYGFGAEKVRAQMHEIFTGERGCKQIDFQITTASGERRDWSLTTSAPGTLRDGRRFAIGMVIDLTERIRAEQGLRASEERLREADSRKNQFLAMLGHELRNPLAAIRGGIALLQSDKTSAATRAKTLPLVAAQVAHMERLIDDLLDVTRIVEGRLKVRRERVTVQQSLEDAVAMVRAQAPSEKFEIRSSISPAPLTVLGDPVRLTQIFVNILTNAVKHSGDARQIDITAAKKDHTAVVSIRDYGPGIPPELLPRIFEPFVQAKPTVTLDGGLGLGLAVVRQLVALHGGRVEANSDGERPGAEFVIELPLAPNLE